MKEQLREEIERIWRNKMNGQGYADDVDRLGKLAVILRDLEAADASARYAGNGNFSAGC